MPRSGRTRWWLLLAGILAGAPASANAQTEGPGNEQTVSVGPDGLRTFTLTKPPDQRAQEQDEGRGADNLAAPKLPRSSDLFRTTIGVGYVRGADWGTELVATGAASGIQVQLESLTTRGLRGTRFDHGSLALSDPDLGWRVETGDVFSNLRGIARGARLAWRAAGGREPALSVYGPRPGVAKRPTVLAYRDQLRVRSQTLLDAEVASDKSYLLSSHLSARRWNVGAAYRRQTKPVPAQDRGIDAGIAIWSGVRVSSSFFRSDGANGRSQSSTLSVRVPLSRRFDLTFERAVTTTSEARNITEAAVANMTTGRLHLFHRYQHGESSFSDLALGTIEREELQSAASYAPGPRLNVALQLATEWRADGRLQQWEELQTTMRPTHVTALQIVTALSRPIDPARLRVRLTQELWQRYSLQIEYVRLASFQDISFETDRPRWMIMLRKALEFRTPARGGALQGRVLDPGGRPVAGVRISLGQYSTDSDRDGAYAFARLPAGDYELTLDGSHLPADYAWDGRRLRLKITPFSRLRADLLVAPLNAIHGRVYCDRNGNGRYDVGEGVANAILHLEDSATATDASGAYSFYNVWPGSHHVRLDELRLAPELVAIGPVDLDVTLTDAGPVTGADFRVAARTKPTVWRQIR